MPKTRKSEVLLRTTGWEAKKRKGHACDDTAQYLVSAIPAPPTPSTSSSPGRAGNAAPDTGVARLRLPVAAALLPQPEEDRRTTAGARCELETAQRAAEDTAPCRWPAVIALLPNGSISGAGAVGPQLNRTSINSFGQTNIALDSSVCCMRNSGCRQRLV